MFLDESQKCDDFRRKRPLGTMEKRTRPRVRLNKKLEVGSRKLARTERSLGGLEVGSKRIRDGRQETGEMI